MVEKLTVIFFIILCIFVGLYLTLLPWMSIGLSGDWSENFFLVFVADRIGLPALQQIIASTWVRGAVTGLGILNLIIAFWELAHFKQSVQTLKSPLQVKTKSE